MTSSTHSSRPNPPPSVTNCYVNLLGLIFAVTGLIVLARFEIDALWATAICLGLVALPIVIGDLTILKVHHRKTTGLKARGDSRNPLDLNRIIVKCVGLWAVRIE